MLNDRTLRRIATMTTGLVFVQILLGATMRHTGAGLAIPDFPLMFGRLIPPNINQWDPKIAIHFAHRVGALVVTFAIVATFTHVWYHHRNRSELTRPALLGVMLVGVQVALGASTVLSGRDVAINSAHVVVGALVLATSLVLTLRTWRGRFETVQAVAPSVRSVRLQAGQSAAPSVRSVRLQADRSADDGARA